MELADVRAIALGLPEATEAPHHDMTSFRVRGKIFATAPADEAHVHVFVDESETAAAVAECPTWCAELWWGKKLSGVRVTLADADPQRVAELVEESYRRRAPKKLIAELDAPLSHACSASRAVRSVTRAMRVGRVARPSSARACSHRAAWHSKGGGGAALRGRSTRGAGRGPSRARARAAGRRSGRSSRRRR